MYYLSETRIVPMAKVKIERLLPRRGQVTKSMGARVLPDDVVAAAELPGPLRLVDAARRLGLKDLGNLEKYLKKQVGATVEEGELLAAKYGIIPLIRRACRAPFAGKIGAVGDGWIVLQEQTPPFQLRALVSGVINSVMPSLGVVIEVTGRLIEGVVGVGGETYGVMHMASKSCRDRLGAEAIDVGCTGSVVVGGSSFDLEALRQAEQVRVRGVIVGSMDAAILNLNPPPSIPIVVTEGLGSIPMSSTIFDLLKESEGQEVSIVARSQMRRGLILPQIIVPVPGEIGGEIGSSGALEIGDRVRALRPPHVGQMGRVRAFPPETRIMESGLRLPGVEVDLEEGTTFIPALNLEAIR